MRSLFLVMVFLLASSLYAKSEFDEYFTGIYDKSIEKMKQAQKELIKKLPKLRLKELSESEIEGVMESYKPLKRIIRKQAGYKENDYYNDNVNLTKDQVTSIFFSRTMGASVLCKAKVISTKIEHIKPNGTEPFASLLETDLLVELKIQEIYWGGAFLKNRKQSIERVYFRTGSNEGYVAFPSRKVPQVGDSILIPLIKWDNTHGTPFFRTSDFYLILPHKTFGKMLVSCWNVNYGDSNLKIDYDTAMKVISNIIKIGEEYRKKEGLKSLK